LSLFVRAGYGSESEGDEEAATVTLSSDLGRVNKGATKSAVKLQEIGPRMTMQLVKVEEGLCTGGIIFSEYEDVDGKKEKLKKKQDEEEEEDSEEEGEEGSEEDGEDMDEDFED
jgi:ribosome biogenesis protein SSF1/2